MLLSDFANLVDNPLSVSLSQFLQCTHNYRTLDLYLAITIAKIIFQNPIIHKICLETEEKHTYKYFSDSYDDQL